MIWQDGKKLNSLARCKNEKVLGRSDHFPVLMSGFGKAIKRRRKIRKNKKGFKWATADDERFFRHGFMRSMSFNGCATTMKHIAMDNSMLSR